MRWLQNRALRPHAKTHKCSQIARMQVARGAIGVCCQTVGEAEAMVEGGIADVLVTNQIVDERKLARLVHLAARARIGLCVEAIAQIPLLASVSARRNVSVEVYVEIDVGSARCGISPGPRVLELVNRIREFSPLRFAGLHAYNGKIQSIRNYTERHEAAKAVADIVADTVGRLRARDVECPVLTGGGTGTFEADIAAGVLNEVQPGSYIFSDADYAQIETGPGARFENSLFVLSRVISRPSSERAVIDAGLKALAFDRGPPTVVAESSVRYSGPTDEHGRVELPKDTEAPPVGATVALIPGHCDPTVNLYDWMVAIKQGRVEAVWAIKPRGSFSQETCARTAPGRLIWHSAESLDFPSAQDRKRPDLTALRHSQLA